MRYLHLIVRLIKQPWNRKRLLLESVIGFSRFRVLLFLLPFKRFSSFLGILVTDCPDDQVVLPEELRDIAWAVNRACRVAPWGKKCLIRAATAKWIAQRHGYRLHFFLGVGRNDKRDLIYHAWSKYHGHTITGGETEGVYNTLAIYH